MRLCCCFVIDCSEVLQEPGNSGLECVHVSTGPAGLLLSLPLHSEVPQEHCRHHRLAYMGAGVSEIERKRGRVSC